MRGKGVLHPVDSAIIGITPAHAGKSSSKTPGHAAHRDHPRACGEKYSFDIIVERQEGSPPRMRGKDTLRYILRFLVGITPAHAGKSLRPLVQPLPARDHPRACGEKETENVSTHHRIGSPPRMRGKVVPLEGVVPDNRITPAHAGKSCLSAAAPVRGRDHPRACGEKSSIKKTTPAYPGSPPRMRGKEAQACNHGHGVGITPAHAGKR